MRRMLNREKRGGRLNHVEVLMVCCEGYQYGHLERILKVRSLSLPQGGHCTAVVDGWGWWRQARLHRRWDVHFWMWWDASHASLEPLSMPLNRLGGHSILFQYPWMLLITLWDSPDYSRSTNHHPFKPPTESSKSLFIILHFILIQESDLIITK